MSDQSPVVDEVKQFKKGDLKGVKTVEKNIRPTAEDIEREKKENQEKK